MAKKTRVGFVGLGAMGIGMATQLLEKGFPVAAFEVREEVKERWVSAGGEWSDSPAAAAVDADVFVTMVVNAEQIESVLFGGKGALKKLRPKSVVIVTSTVSPSFSRELGKRLSSAINIFVKDLGIVLDVAHELRFPIPMAALAHQLFIAAAAVGQGSQDDASIVKLYENLSGVSVKKPR
jgi:3-hydroxyisobutyrate dehydrogenase-like beta-hydroxyacid dehydrogenase